MLLKKFCLIILFIQGLSATLNERNSNNVQSIPIKPHIHEAHDLVFYKPQKYLQARKEHDSMASKPESLQVNNTEVNRIFNLKKTNNDRVNRFHLKKIEPVYHISALSHTKKLGNNKNASQIVFGNGFNPYQT